MEPGGGMLVAALRVLYDIDPIVLGKPSRFYADIVRQSVRTDGPIVMFGDSQRADIGIAGFLGADGVLVTTKPTTADLPQPQYVTTSLADPILTVRGPGTMSVTVERAIPYAEKEGFRFLEVDVYRPADQQGPLPLLHYVHGGGWRVSSRQRAPRETRAWTPSLFEQMVGAGFVVAASDYRFSGEASVPGRDRGHRRRPGVHARQRRPVRDRPHPCRALRAVGRRLPRRRRRARHRRRAGAGHRVLVPDDRLLGARRRRPGQ